MFDTFDRYRMYASTLKIGQTLENLIEMQKTRGLNDLEMEQKYRFEFVMDVTQAAPSAVESSPPAVNTNRTFRRNIL